MTVNTEEDIYFMRIALEEAALAGMVDEVPVGAVLVKEGKVLARTHNLRESSRDPSAHAEVLALREGAGYSDSWRLSGATLYATKEPCIMCAGTIVNSRIARLVYGCKDLKAGGVDSLYNILRDERLNHQVEVTAGVLEEECALLLKKFFRERR
jgi:tRNA(adenine34) deaminase